MTRIRKRRGAVLISFAGDESKILAGLLRSLVELLYDGLPARESAGNDPLADLLDNDGPTAPPDDEVLRRLLPDAYGDGNAEAAADFRRYTERGLRDGKAGDAKLVLEAVEGADPDGELEIRAEDRLSWLRALNDLRLALGTRLGIEQDDYEFWEKLPDDDPRRLTYDLYDWLGYLQSALLHHIS